MLKTLKPDEKHILLEEGFLELYLKHMMEQPDSLLLRFYGLYEVEYSEKARDGKEEKKTICFFVTDNLLGLDGPRVVRCFDFKGSSYGRKTDIEEEEFKNGSGTKTLKDQNLIDFVSSDLTKNNKLFDIDQTTRTKLFEQLPRDTALLH